MKVGKLIGQKWRELSDEDKQPYFEEYEAEKAVYVEQVKRYKNSPAYKKWMEAKQQGTNWCHTQVFLWFSLLYAKLTNCSKA